MVGMLFGAEIAPDAAMEMDDEISRGHVMEFGSGGMVGAAPLLPADMGAVGDLRIRDGGVRNIGDKKPRGKNPFFKAAFFRPGLKSLFHLVFFRIVCIEEEDREVLAF